MPYHARSTDNVNKWFLEKLKLLPFALALLSLIGFLFMLSARVTSLEAEETTTKTDIKEINMSFSDLRDRTARIEEKINNLKDDTSYIKQHLK